MNIRYYQRRLPLGLLGALGLVVACEWTIARGWMNVSGVPPAMFRFAGHAAQEQAPGAEILCLGDSLVKFGLVPEVLEASLNRSAYNLAVMGGQPPSSYFLLRRALKAGSRPRAVVVNFKANCLAATPWINYHQWASLGSLTDCLDLAWESPNASLCGTMLADWLLPSYQARYQIRSGFLAALAGRKTSTREDIQTHWRNWVANKGAQVMPKNPEGRVNPAFLFKEVYYPEHWWCDPVNARYMRRFLKLARKEGIPVFWLLAPIQPAVQTKREQVGLDERYMKIVRHALRDFPNLVVIDGRHAGYRPEVFVDYSHLDHEGAGALSTGVASILNEYLSGGGNSENRMVALPPYQDSEKSRSLEDVSQSRLALGYRD